MAEEKGKPTLKDLSQKLFALCDAFEDLSHEFMLKEEYRKSAEKLYGILIEFLCMVYDTKKTAVKTSHPSVWDFWGPGTVMEVNEISSTIWWLEEIDVHIQAAIRKFTHAKLEEEGFKKRGEPYPEDFKSPGNCLIDTFCFGINNDWEWGAISIMCMPLKEVANKLSGIFLQEEREQEVDSGKKKEIPPDQQTLEMSKQELADLYGGNMTPDKITKRIDKGQLNVIKQSRQSFIFDKRDLPEYIVEKLNNLK